MANAHIILDNGGGITLQLGDWAHHYDNAKACAREICEWLETRTTDGWEGHDEDALACQPTWKEICNGGYFVVNIVDGDTLETLAADVEKYNGHNAQDLALALRGI